jgi:hypothetical protein
MQDSGQNKWQETLLKRPPVVIPRRKPDEILGDNYEEIKEVLRSFGKSRSEWDEYAKKIDPVLRETMKKCFSECRDNGFYGPKIGSDGEIHFAQVIEPPEGINELYRVSEVQSDGKIWYSRCAKEYLMPHMTIVSRIR